MIRKRNLDASLSNWIMGQTGLGPGVGDIFFLVPATGATAQFKNWVQGQGIDEGHYSSSLTAIEDKMVNGRNDVLIVLPGSHALTAALNWDKSYTHILGSGPPVQINQRSRLVGSLATVTPLFTLSADGCIIKNVMIDQQGSHATTAAVCGKITGARNYLENVTFRHIGALGVVDNSWRPLVINSSNGENNFVRCTIGNDTVDGVTAANYTMEFNGAVQTARNIFEDCIFFGNGSANSCFILATTVSALASFQIFKRCLFLNNDMGDLDAMTQGFNLHADNGGLFIFQDCLVYGAATLETTNSGKILVRNAPAAATGDIAVAATF
jgi:hypothetical protein